MRLSLLTVEGKGLKEDDVEQPRTRGGGREGKKRTKTESGGTRRRRRRRKSRRRHQAVERSENYSQGISLEHPLRRQARGKERERGKRSSLSTPLSFSLTHAPFASASLFVFTLGASRGGMR